MFPLSLAWSLAPVLRTNTVTWNKVHILKIVSFIKRGCHNSSPNIKSYETWNNIWFSSNKPKRAYSGCLAVMDYHGLLSWMTFMDDFHE